MYHLKRSYVPLVVCVPQIETRFANEKRKGKSFVHTLCLLGLLKKCFYYYFKNQLSCTRNVKINKMITTESAVCFILKLFSLV